MPTRFGLTHFWSKSHAVFFKNTSSTIEYIFAIFMNLRGTVCKNIIAHTLCICSNVAATTPDIKIPRQYIFSYIHQSDWCILYDFVWFVHVYMLCVLGLYFSKYALLNKRYYCWIKIEVIPLHRGWCNKNAWCSNITQLRNNVCAWYNNMIVSVHWSHYVLAVRSLIYIV